MTRKLQGSGPAPMVRGLCWVGAAAAAYGAVITDWRAQPSSGAMSAAAAALLVMVATGKTGKKPAGKWLALALAVFALGAAVVERGMRAQWW
jgi:hypothetical protein